MNVNIIQSIIAPLSKAMPHTSGTEAAMDFVALIENAPQNGGAKSPAPDAPELLPTPAAADAKVATSAPVLVAAPVAVAPKATSETKAMPIPKDPFRKFDLRANGADQKINSTTVTPSIAKADPTFSPTAPSGNAPVTEQDLGQRFAADIGKRSAEAEPVKVRQDGEAATIPVKPDLQLAKKVPDQLVRPPLALANIIDAGHFEDEPQDPAETPSGELTTSFIQASGTPAAQPIVQPVTSGNAQAPATDFAQSQSDLPRDIKATLPRADSGHEKIIFATAEIPAKSQTVEQPVTPFSMPVPAPIIAAPSTLTAPIFATPDVFSSQQLDLARDTQWIEQLAREIVSVAGQDGKLRFGLAPDGLGQLEVMVETQQDGVNIQFQASTENAAKIIASEQPKLLEELRQSGVRVANSDLMAGHHMQGQRDQSRNQNPGWQTQTGQPFRNTPSSNQHTSHSGRFA